MANTKTKSTNKSAKTTARDKAAAKPRNSTKNQSAKPKGRPAGRKNNQVDHAEGQLTRCPKCNSTERAPYSNKLVQQHAGLDAAGRPYTAIVRRRTRCLQCGQHRIDRHVEYTRAKK